MLSTPFGNGATINRLPTDVSVLVIVIPDALKLPTAYDMLSDYIQSNINTIKPSTALYVVVDGAVPAIEWRSRTTVGDPAQIATTPAAKDLDNQIRELLKLRDTKIPSRTTYSPSTEFGPALNKVLAYFKDLGFVPGPKVVVGLDTLLYATNSLPPTTSASIYTWDSNTKSGYDVSKMDTKILGYDYYLIALMTGEGRRIPSLELFGHKELIANRSAPLVRDTGSIEWSNFVKFLVELRKKEPTAAASTAKASDTFNFANWVKLRHARIIDTEYASTLVEYAGIPAPTVGEKIARDMAAQYLALIAQAIHYVATGKIDGRVQYTYRNAPLVADLLQYALDHVKDLTTLGNASDVEISIYDYWIGVIPWKYRGILPAPILRQIESKKITDARWSLAIDEYGPITYDMITSLKLPASSPAYAKGAIEIHTTMIDIKSAATTSHARKLKWHTEKLF